jgi:hypothetical protein
MSFSMTTQAVRDGTKTVTRRLGWWGLQPGTLLQAVEKAQGLKKGEHVKPLGVIRVVSVCREPLYAIVTDRDGDTEAEREGFPKLNGEGFITMFVKANGCTAGTWVNRIEFEYVDEVPGR